jgi:hypothetical protein
MCSIGRCDASCEADVSHIEDAFATLTRRGLPAVRGEVVDGDVGGYHYYPRLDQVTAWLTAAGLHILEGEGKPACLRGQAGAGFP